MRHDAHFVDALAERFGASLGKYLPVTEIETNPDQPRHNVGDLSDLKASIESKGILEPILVRPTADGTRFQIISGERRFRAALEAGLTEVPAIEFDVPENEVLEIALIENLHRKDLTPFEEAEGFQSLIDRHGYTHQHVAETLAKSRVGVTESLSLLRIPEDLRNECRRADIQSKSLLLDVARAGDREAMEKRIRAILAGATREALRQQKKEDEGDDAPRRARPFQFRYAPKNSPFRLNLAFNRSRVGKEEVVEALERIIEEIRRGEVDIRKK
jgi:ParB family chromosome partitioning protein